MITWQPSVSVKSVTMWPCALTTNPLPYSTAFTSAAKGAPSSGNGENAFAIAPITGSTMVSIIWSYSKV